MPAYEESSNLSDKHLAEPLAASTEHRELDVRHADESSPFTQRMRGEIDTDARAIHEGRTRASRTADESYNAPVAGSYRQWLRNPDRYDLPGVDTIPRERQARRGMEMADRALDIGAIDEILIDDPDRTANNPGKFEASATGGQVVESRISIASGAVREQMRDLGGDTDARSLGFLVAHETGHALDLHFGPRGLGGVGYAHDTFDEDRYRDADFGAVTTRMRGDLPDPSYQFSRDELTADAVAAYTLEPRALKRESPEVFGLIDDELMAPLESAVSRK